MPSDITAGLERSVLMSIQLMAAVWQLDITSSEKLVLLALADHCKEDGVCWPSVGLLTRKCSLNERTVQRCLKSLQKRSLLHRDYRSGHSTKYLMKLPPSPCRGSKPKEAATSHLPPPKSHHRPRHNATQNLNLNHKESKEVFASQEDEVVPLSAEVEALLQKFYTDMKRV